MKILHFLDKNAEKVLCSALLGISCIVLFLQIVFRVAGSPLPWSEELGRYMFIWLIYIGSSAAIRERRHISLDLIDLFTGSRVQLIIRIFDNLVFFVFGVILAYYGWLVTLRGFPSGICLATYEYGTRLCFDFCKWHFNGDPFDSGYHKTNSGP